MEYLLHLLIVAALYGALASALDLVVGHTGLVTLAQAAFSGLGAYASALLTLHAGWPFAAGLLAGMVLAALLSLLISLPSLRLRDDFFVLATFGFQMILFGVLDNWTSLTRGPLGIADIPRPSIAGWTLVSRGELAVLALGLLGGTLLVVSRLAESPFGRVLRAVRESEPFAWSLGKDTLQAKIGACAVSAALAAAAGSLYAGYVTFIDPTSFDFQESIMVLSMVILGGAASRWGPVAGAVVLVLLPEALRTLGLSSTAAAHLRQIAYGVLLVWAMRVRPQGLLGRYDLG
jgi:branched-chain amino acid transport system permease protein